MRSRFRAAAVAPLRAFGSLWRRVLAANGFSVLSMGTKSIRQDRHEPVEGLVVVATLPSDAFNV